MDFLQVLAHEGEELVEVAKPSLEETIRANSFKFTLMALGLLLFLAVLALVFKNISEKLKYLLFGTITVVSVLTTLYLAGSTIYLNQVSETGGPIHWHADFEIWHCGRQVNIKDPTGFSNKVGTEVVHEHNDNRMHFEGVLLDLHDASLGHFFEALGGSMVTRFSNAFTLAKIKHLTVPTSEGELTMFDGVGCPDGARANMQVFVYQTKNGQYSQQKLKIEEAQDYIISPHSQVPPGDCIIIEFDKPKDKTDKLCNFYKVAKEKGEILNQVQDDN